MRTIRPRRPIRTAVALVTLLAMPSLVGSCSDDGSTESSDEPAAIATTIHIVDGEFDPREVEIEVGGTVQWINDDVNPHQLISLDIGELASPLLVTGQAWTFQFAAPGEVLYYDAFRATMKGTVIVR